MSRRMVDLVERDIAGNFEQSVWPGHILATLELEVCCKTAPVPRLDNFFPKIFLATGLNTTRLTYSGTAQHLASLGYEVIIMDHPYETDVVEFPNGDLIFGGRIAGERNNTVMLDFGLTVRSKDTSFVMDRLGIHKTTFIGHSYGGSAAADVLLREPRILAGANMDGALNGPASKSGVSKPFLILGSQGHNSTGPGINFEPTWGPFFDAMDKNFPKVWKRELSERHSAHISWTDCSLIFDAVPELRENKALELFCGVATGKRAMQVMKHYIGQFIEFTLLHAGQGNLSRSNPEFPDVVIVR